MMMNATKILTCVLALRLMMSGKTCSRKRFLGDSLLLQPYKNTLFLRLIKRKID